MNGIFCRNIRCFLWHDSVFLSFRHVRAARLRNVWYGYIPRAKAVSVPEGIGNTDGCCCCARRDPSNHDKAYGSPPMLSSGISFGNIRKTGRNLLKEGIFFVRDCRKHTRNRKIFRRIYALWQIYRNLEFLLTKSHGHGMIIWVS